MGEEIQERQEQSAALVIQGKVTHSLIRLLTHLFTPRLTLSPTPPLQHCTQVRQQHSKAVVSKKLQVHLSVCERGSVCVCVCV